MKYNYLKSLLTALLLLCSTVATAHDFEVDGIYYNITDSTHLTVAVTYKGNNYYDHHNEYSGEVFIQPTVTFEGQTYNVTSIGAYAFTACSSMTLITLPNSITSVGYSAFSSCTGLSSISIPSSVTSIGDNTFSGCSNLASIIIEGFVSNFNLNTIRGTLIYNDLADGELIYIGDYFLGIKGENSYSGDVYIREGTKYVMGLGTDNNLINIYIPASVEYIANIAGGEYDSCPECEDYYWVSYPEAYVVDAENTNYSAINGILYNKDQTELVQKPCGYTEKIVIPATVQRIKSGAFFGGYYGRVYKIECHGMTAPVWENFDKKNNITAYVPLEATDSYINEPTWASVLVQPMMDAYKNKVALYGTTFENWRAQRKDYDSGYTFSQTYTFSAKKGEKFSFDYSTYQADTEFSIDINDKRVLTIAGSRYIPEETFEFYILEDNDYTVELTFWPYDTYEYVEVSNVALSKCVYKNKRIDFDDWTSPATDHSNTSLKSYTFTANAGSSLTFDWETSSENNFDKLICTLDGTMILTQSGVGNSGTYSGTVPTTGEHTLFFIYSKDSSESRGDDKVAVKNISVTTTIENYDRIEHYAIDETNAQFIQQYVPFTANNFTYKRTFDNTKWQAMYLPFDIPYDNLEGRVEVAIPNDVHQYDDNNDGTIDRTELEAIKVKGGTLMNNFPYLVKAKNEGDFILELENALIPTNVENSYNISSLNTKYYLNGTYSPISGEVMIANKYYAVVDGTLSTTDEPSDSIPPYRWYMNAINDIDDFAAPRRSIAIRILDRETNDIDYIQAHPSEDGACYDLSGRRVATPGKGIYIVNGKKIIK